MAEIITYETVEDKIISIRNQEIIIDSDVAALYGVPTKRVNEAVRNNPDKFPAGYILALTRDEWQSVRSKFSSSPLGGGKVRAPKAFTERGLYMLATILKSAAATKTTICIIDTFAKIREAGRVIKALPATDESDPKHQKLVKRAGEIVSDLVVPEGLVTNETETSVEFNLAVMKLKYLVKKKVK